MEQQAAEKILAFDFGTKSIGVAMGNKTFFTVEPENAIHAADGIPEQGRLTDLFNKWQPDLVVVGLPLNADGSWQEVTFRARKFARRLSSAFHIRCEMKDERYSTKQARDELFNDGGYRALEKGKIDSLSAVIILNGWFESGGIPLELCQPEKQHV